MNGEAAGFTGNLCQQRRIVCGLVGVLDGSAALLARAMGFTPENSPSRSTAPSAPTRNTPLVASSTTSTGCYGITANDTNPYPGGGRATSTDDGATFTAEPPHMKLRTVVVD